MSFLTLSRAFFFGKTRRTSVLSYLELYRQRRALTKLNDHLLEDIGLDRRSAEEEAKRPIWDAPDYFRK